MGMRILVYHQLAVQATVFSDLVDMIRNWDARYIVCRCLLGLLPLSGLVMSDEPL